MQGYGGRETRGEGRWEPGNLAARLSIKRSQNRSHEIEGLVLDSSRTGVAVSLKEDCEPPGVDAMVDLTVWAPGTNDIGTIRNARIVRTWRVSGPFDGGFGAALDFGRPEPDDDVSQALQHGTRHDQRVGAQDKILFGH